MHEGMSIHDKLCRIEVTQDMCDDSSEITFRYSGPDTVPMALERAALNTGTHYWCLRDVPDRKLYTAILAAMAGSDSVGHSVEKVILNDPATVAYVDGKRVVTKAKDGDEYDPLMGLLVCATRVAGKNRVSIDAWEHVLCMLADNLATAEECRMLADVLTLAADLWDAKGVAGKMDEWAKDHVAETFDLPCEQPENHEPSKEERAEKLANDVSDLIEMAAEATSTEPMASREAVRQTICDLFERGEL